MFVTDYIYKNRNGKRQKVGMFIGCEIDGEIRIGYSLCDKEDVFDEEYAMALAGIRALSPFTDACPPSIAKDAERFAENCLLVFPYATLMEPLEDSVARATTITSSYSKTELPSSVYVVVE